MTLRDDNLRLVLAKAIADALAGAMGGLREDHFDVLLEQYQETGTKQFVVKLPDETKVATITLTEQKESYEVTDPQAFLDWMRDTNPDGIETVEIPATEAYSYAQVRPRAQDAVVKRLDHVGDMALDPATGEIVPGITYRPAGRPKGFQVRYETDGRHQVIDAWRTGALAELVGSDVLPQIGAQ